MKQVRVAAGNLPPVGEFVTLLAPGYESIRYVVVSVEEDPTGVWRYDHFIESEGGPDITPQTYLLNLKRLP